MIKSRRFWAWLILTLGILLLLIWFIYSQVPLKNIYLYKTGTDIPIANQYATISYSEPFCDSYSCPSRTYEGYTKNDGSFQLTLRDALRIQNEIGERYSPYSIEINNFDYQPNTIPSDKQNTFLIYLTEVKNADAPLKITLGEEVRLISDLTNEFTLQLHSINQKTQMVELWLILNSYYSSGPVIQSFILQKNVPSYIPREISDSQLVLTDIQEKHAIFNFLPQLSTTAWDQREIDHTAELNMDDQRYLNALNYFKKIEEQYKEYSGGELVKLTPFKYENGWVEAIGLVASNPEWIIFGELPKKGGVCLVSHFYLNKNPKEQDKSGTSNRIVPCLPYQGGLDPIDKLLYF